MRSKRLLAVSIAIVGLVAAAFAQNKADDEKPASEKSVKDPTAAAKDPVADIQGTWQMVQKGPDGTVYKMVKTITGKKELVSYFTGNELVSAHTVELDIKKTDQVMVFTYRNMTVTHGPDKGTVQKGPFSYLYRIKGDKWYVVFGLLEDDDRPFEVAVFEKVKEKDKDNEKVPNKTD